jgi:hypothetical protein
MKERMKEIINRSRMDEEINEMKRHEGRWKRGKEK